MEVSHHTVTDADTAESLGSGDMPVLATPRLINWIERAAFRTAAETLQPGQTTVGTMVKVEHIKASPVGTTVHVKSSRPVSDGRRLIFHVRVLDDSGEEVATGEVERAVVDRERFMRRFGITFPVVYDGPGGTTDDYGVTGFPETFVIDRDGRVVAAFAGAVNGDEERARLESAIADALST